MQGQRIVHGRHGQALAAAIVLAVALAPASRALELTVSGHVNRVVRFADDGKASDIQFLDFDASNTRVRFDARGDVGRGMRARILVEAGLFSNNSATVGLKDGDVGGFWAIRHSALGFMGPWGELALGETSEAFDSVAEADLSDTWLVDEPADDLASFVAWRRGDGSTIPSALGGPLRIADTREDFDGARQDVLRYDSPALGPFVLRGNVSNDNNWSVRGDVAHDFGPVEIELRAGYRKGDQRDGFNSFTTSGSLLTRQGFNLTLMYGRRDLVGGGSDPQHFYVKGGYKWGNNAASIGWSTVRDLVDGVDSDRFTVGFVHTLPRPRIELYANFQHYPGLDGISNVEDINAAGVGARVAFD